MEKKQYKAPTLIAYGRIEDHTFATPGGHVKGSAGQLHVDNFGETVGRRAENSPSPAIS